MSISPRQTSRPRPSTFLLLTVVSLCLLWHFVRLAQPANLSAYEAFFPMLWGGLAALLGRRGETWQRKSFWLLAGSFCYLFLRCMADGPVSLRGNTDDIFNALLVFGVYYQLAFGFTAEQLKSYLRVLCGVWALLETVLALAGLWVALYDQVIPTLAGSNVLGLSAQRLNLFFYATITSSNLTTSIALACVGLFVARRTVSRVLYALSILIMWMALGLTATRSGYLTIGLALGLYLSLPLLRLLRTRTRVWEWLLRVLCLALAVGFVAGSYFALNATIPLFNDVQANVRAQAEEGVETLAPPEESDPWLAEGAEWLDPLGTVDSVQQRPLQFDSHLFTERQYIWDAVIRYYQEHPSDLLFGLGLVNPLEQVMVYLEADYEYLHTHSIYLQVLMEYGLVGVALMLLFLWRLASASLRLFFAKDRPLWQCALPVLPVMALVTDLMECFLLLNCNYPALSFTMLFAGLTLYMAPGDRDLLPAYAKGGKHEKTA